jgi:16S rRNA (adenine1518-N6/adenine1519-N6)-dimethyltransferase
VEPIASAPTVRRLLQELKLSPNRLLGQNFLISAVVAENIVQAAGITESGKVLEIGPGLGALSELLAARAEALALVELDEKLYVHLRRLFADKGHVQVIRADALKFNYTEYAVEQCWQDYLVVANLPYSITSPLIQRLLLQGSLWRSLTLMVQSEVAQKLLPAPTGETSGPLALLAQYYGTVSILFTVPKECFFPEPQVESAVIQLIRHTSPPFAFADTELFMRFLSAAFNHRRKTLANSLSNSLGGGAERWRLELKNCGIGEGKRAEQLTLPDYVALFTQTERMWALSD